MVMYKRFRPGFLSGLNSALDEAARFASSLKPGQIINISIADTDDSPASVIVWFKDTKDIEK